MTKTIKLKDNTYWDTKGIMHNKKLLSDVLYPVGSIYMSVNSTNPSTLFGGTWEQITGRFLYCTNTSKTTGGSNTTGSAGGGNTGSTVLQQSNLPSRTVVCTKANMSNSAWGDTQAYNGYSFHCLADSGETSGKGHTHIINAHTHTQNLPPYFTVYCWYRTK